MLSSTRFLFLCLFVPLGARAYETDQLTHRNRYLDDSAPFANDLMNVVLDNAIQLTNEQTLCRGTDQRMRRVLGHHIFHLSATPKFQSRRGGLRGFGFGKLTADLEDLPPENLRTFPEGEHVFAQIGPETSIILGSVGPSGTLRIGNTLLGTDKFDHFLDLGYEYAKWSNWGRSPQRAIRRGTRTENTYFGMMTSNSFSFGDLRANWDGYLFYSELLTPTSVVQRDESGCAKRFQSFDWEVYIDDEYDEVLNPPTFHPRVQDAIRQHLLEHRLRYCAEYYQWGHGYPEILEAMFSKDPPYASPHAPARHDPWDLVNLCGRVR